MLCDCIDKSSIEHRHRHSQVAQTMVNNKPTFIRYTPKTAGPDGARIIRMVEAPVDPLEPPKFKVQILPIPSYARK